MIYSLPITLLVEGAVVLVYSGRRKKSARDLFWASLIVNVLTQTMLWVVLQIFFRDYLVTLFVMEIVIWLVESLLMYRLSNQQLTLLEAVTLSLLMNLSSFGVGWWLPV